MDVLTKEKIKNQFHSLSNHWTLNKNSISCKLKFENFIQAFTFMKSIALDAERIDHHPKWENIYNIVNVSLSTHDAEGLTDNDFELAKIIDNRYKLFS